MHLVYELISSMHHHQDLMSSPSCSIMSRWFLYVQTNHPNELHEPTAPYTDRTKAISLRQQAQHNGNVLQFCQSEPAFVLYRHVRVCRLNTQDSQSSCIPSDSRVHSNAIFPFLYDLTLSKTVQSSFYDFHPLVPMQCSVCGTLIDHYHSEEQ